MKKSLTLLGLMATAFALHSCIDKDYDLDNIDKTFGNITELTLPPLSTSDIVLRNIMDIAEDDDESIIQFVTDQNGKDIFCVVQTGKAEIDPIKIEPISFAPELSPIEARINIGTPSGAPAHKKSPRKISVVIGGNTYNIPNEYFEKNFEYYITPESGAHHELTTDPVSVIADVRRLDYVGVNERITLTLNLKVDKRDEKYPWLKYIHFNNARLAIPEELELDESNNYKNCTFNGEPIVDVKKENGSDIVILTSEDSAPIDITKPITLALTFKGIRNTGANLHFTPNPDDTKDGTVTLDGKFEITGTLELKAQDILTYAEDEFTEWIQNPSQGPAIVAKILADKSLQSIVPKWVDITGNAGFDNGSIDVLTVTGKFKHAIGTIDPIMLDDMPDFLSDPAVVLDLQNPAILLKASNEMPATANTAITLTSHANGQTHTVSAPSVQIKREGTTLFCLADAQPDFLPDEYEGAEKLALDPSKNTVKSLIEKIPDQIDVDIQAVELEAENIKINHPYNVGIDYEVFAPLIMGPKFNLVYEDKDDGWGSDLEDVEDIDLGYLELKALVDSDIPADITLTLTPIDANGNKIDDLKVGEIAIPANANKSAIQISIEPTTGHTINDALTGRNGVKQLDGIRYKATIDNPNTGVAIPKEAKIKIYDIYVTIKGGITYDAN